MPIDSPMNENNDAKFKQLIEKSSLKLHENSNKMMTIESDRVKNNNFFEGAAIEEDALSSKNDGLVDTELCDKTL